MSAALAKSHFADCLRRAEAGEPVVITRHGRAVVALVPAAELKQLERLRRAGPKAGLASIAGGWKGSGEPVRAIQQSRRRGTRRVPDPWTPE